MGIVALRQEDAVAVVTIDRPDALNALNAQVVAELTACFEALGSNRRVRAILLKGAGERAFVAGADIQEFPDATPLDAEKLASEAVRMHQAMRRCPQPIVAAINGFCLGGGFELALCCDILLASDKARFGLPEIKLGVIPGGGGTIRLALVAGMAAARAIAMSGEMIDAERARELGIVHAVYPAAELAASALDFARRLAAMPPIAMAQIKSTLDALADGFATSALAVERRAFALCFATNDQKEGARAFLEKRAPEFVGK